MASPLADPEGDAYERALRDPTFLEAVRAAHRGSWDVLDALWWAAHPNDAAPSGEAAPGVRVRDLQRRVFAADADAVGDPAVTSALRELEGDVARESLAIDAAVVAARFADSRGGDPAPLLVQAPAASAGPAIDAPPALDGPPALDVTPAGVAQDDPASHVARSGTRPARLRLAATLAGALLLGAVIGGQLAGAAARNVAPSTASSTASSTVSSGTEDREKKPVPALAIFDRARITTDTPGMPVPSSFDRSSLRAVWSVSWDIAGPRAEPPYFVARAAGDRVCLLVLVTDARHASTCVSTVEFAGTGIRLYWISDVAAAADGTAPTPETVNLVLEWNPDGRFEVEQAAANPRTWRNGLCPTDLPRPC